jgi:uncharacterized protein (DUF1800 family)
MANPYIKARNAHYAFNRFGLGAKPAAYRHVVRDPKRALLEEIHTSSIAEIDGYGLPTYESACQAACSSFDDANSIKNSELTARIRKHLRVRIGFVERLVLFFSNHFSVSILKNKVIRATIGQLERDVIRRNVLSSYRDMLVGVMKHPAMLEYLDNASSVGPNSLRGRLLGHGLNQNLAREILELHTLGVDGGYSQTDVQAMSCVLTGWSFVREWEADSNVNGGSPETRGQFIFRPDWHEPGEQTVLGVTFPQDGIAQGEAVLTYLATHPSTAEHLAFKLVQHFIVNTPTPSMVQPVKEAFLSSGGNLRETALALLDLEESWSLPLKKLRTPYELQIAEMRALGAAYPQDERWPFYWALTALNHRPWERLTPDGYPDDSRYWLSPDGMRVRVETAQMNARELAELSQTSKPVSKLAHSLFGRFLSEASRRSVSSAQNRITCLSLLFMTPEFQRR